MRELTLQMILLSLSLNVCNIGLHCNLRFLSTTVLQGSVATRVNGGRIFNDFLIVTVLLSVMVKEFWRSLRIWQSYGKNKVVPFPRTRCRITRFSPKCSEKIAVYQSVQNVYQFVNYSLINCYNWIHVISDVTLHANMTKTSQTEKG